MDVPRLSQLRPGVGVNLVLKADQRSGKLTTGQVSEILTKGDHPRGVKVRLRDGHVGRVQSLSANFRPLVSGQPVPLDNAAHYTKNNLFAYSQQHPGSTERKRRSGRLTMQEDYRDDLSPLESRSLADYMKVLPSSKSASTSQSSAQKNIAQAQLELDFPNLDTALIAAILADHDDPEAARGVLSSIS